MTVHWTSFMCPNFSQLDGCHCDDEGGTMTEPGDNDYCYQHKCALAECEARHTLRERLKPHLIIDEDGEEVASWKAEALRRYDILQTMGEEDRPECERLLLQAEAEVARLRVQMAQNEIRWRAAVNAQCEVKEQAEAKLKAVLDIAEENLMGITLERIRRAVKGKP